MDFKKFFKKGAEELKTDSKSDHKVYNYVQDNYELKDWSGDKHQSALVQRNLLLILLVICLGVILLSLSTIRYLKDTQSIDPFVIEIEAKTGVPTVVEPLSVQAYSANMAINRYFIMQYIRAREEYLSSTFDHNYSDVVRVLSSSDVYYKDYRPAFSINNLSSPYNMYGNGSTVTVGLKSIIFPSANSAQVRITLNVTGQVNLVMNKIIYMEFAFQNLNMNESDRLINPLGFQVTLFRIDDENG
jgi:type IV secretion system protein VirB8